MATVHVWPGLKPDGTSLTVLAEDGVTPIPAAGGAVVPYVTYYSDLMAISHLLDYDPLGLSGDPITVPAITRVSSGLVGVLTSQLAARPGLGDGETVTTSGYSAAYDGGGATWRFALGVSANPGIAAINCSNGQWQLVWDGVVLVADWCGVPRDNSTDALAGLHACLNLRATTYVVQLGPGTYRTTGKLTMPIGKRLRGACGGDGGIHTGPTVGQQNSTIIRYDGPSLGGDLDVAIAVNTACELRDLTVMPTTGKRLRGGIGFQTDGSTTATFSNVGVDCYFGAWASGPAGRGSFDFGYILGGPGVIGNCDNVTIDRGFVRTPSRAAFGLHQGEPFNLVLNQVRLNNFLGGALGTISHGAVFEALSVGSYTGITINTGEIEYCAVLCRGFGGAIVNVTINHVEWEGMKRIWDQPVFAAIGTTANITGGRFDTSHVHRVVYDADPTNTTVAEYIPASDQRVIYERAGVAFSLVGCHIKSAPGNPNDRLARIYLNLHCSVTAISCTFPTQTPVDRGSESGGSVLPSCGTYLLGCRDSEGNPVAERAGCENPAEGIVTISDAATFADVAFAQLESAANSLGTGPRYLVFLSPVASTGSPAAGSRRAYPTNIDVTGFRVNVEAAPGVGASVTFAYQIKLNPTGL